MVLESAAVAAAKGVQADGGEQLRDLLRAMAMALVTSGDAKMVLIMVIMMIITGDFYSHNVVESLQCDAKMVISKWLLGFHRWFIDVYFMENPKIPSRNG